MQENGDEYLKSIESINIASSRRQLVRERLKEAAINMDRHLKEQPNISKFTKSEIYWFKRKGMHGTLLKITKENFL